MSTTQVFISYSHQDKALVTPIVQILRAVGASTFQDVDTIPPGKRWRLVIEESIENAAVVLVFWCGHSRQSAEVRTEWQSAIRAGKDTVPVVLDNTELDPDLADYQAVDLRSLSLSHEYVPPLPGDRMFLQRSQGPVLDMRKLLTRIFYGKAAVEKLKEKLQAEARTRAAMTILQALESRSTQA